MESKTENSQACQGIAQMLTVAIQCLFGQQEQLQSPAHFEHLVRAAMEDQEAKIDYKAVPARIGEQECSIDLTGEQLNQLPFVESEELKGLRESDQPYAVDQKTIANIHKRELVPDPRYPWAGHIPLLSEGSQLAFYQIMGMKQAFQNLRMFVNIENNDSNMVKLKDEVKCSADLGRDNLWGNIVLLFKMLDYYRYFHQSEFPSLSLGVIKLLIPLFNINFDQKAQDDDKKVTEEDLNRGLESFKKFLKFIEPCAQNTDLFNVRKKIFLNKRLYECLISDQESKESKEREEKNVLFLSLYSHYFEDLNDELVIALYNSFDSVEALRGFQQKVQSSPPALISAISTPAHALDDKYEKEEEGSQPVSSIDIRNNFLSIAVGQGKLQRELTKYIEAQNSSSNQSAQDEKQEKDSEGNASSTPLYNVEVLFNLIYFCAKREYESALQDGDQKQLDLDVINENIINKAHEIICQYAGNPVLSELLNSNFLSYVNKNISNFLEKIQNLSDYRPYFYISKDSKEGKEIWDIEKEHGNRNGQEFGEFFDALGLKVAGENQGYLLCYFLEAHHKSYQLYNRNTEFARYHEWLGSAQRIATEKDSNQQVEEIPYRDQENFFLSESNSKLYGIQKVVQETIKSLKNTSGNESNIEELIEIDELFSLYRLQIHQQVEKGAYCYLFYPLMAKIRVVYESRLINLGGDIKDNLNNLFTQEREPNQFLIQEGTTYAREELIEFKGNSKETPSDVSRENKDEDLNMELLYPDYFTYPPQVRANLFGLKYGDDANLCRFIEMTYGERDEGNTYKIEYQMIKNKKKKPIFATMAKVLVQQHAMQQNTGGRVDEKHLSATHSSVLDSKTNEPQSRLMQLECDVQSYLVAVARFDDKKLRKKYFEALKQLIKEKNQEKIKADAKRLEIAKGDDNFLKKLELLSDDFVFYLGDPYVQRLDVFSRLTSIGFHKNLFHIMNNFSNGKQINHSSFDNAIDHDAQILFSDVFFRVANSNMGDGIKTHLGERIKKLIPLVSDIFNRFKERKYEEQRKEFIQNFNPLMDRIIANPLSSNLHLLNLEHNLSVKLPDLKYYKVMLIRMCEIAERQFSVSEVSCSKGSEQGHNEGSSARQLLRPPVPAQSAQPPAEEKKGDNDDRMREIAERQSPVREVSCSKGLEQGHNVASSAQRPAEAKNEDNDDVFNRYREMLRKEAKEPKEAKEAKEELNTLSKNVKTIERLTERNCLGKRKQAFETGAKCVASAIISAGAATYGGLLLAHAAPLIPGVAAVAGAALVSLMPWILLAGGACLVAGAVICCVKEASRRCKELDQAAKGLRRSLAVAPRTA